MAETNYKGRRVLERLVEELGMKEVIFDDKPLQIDCLLRILQTEDKCIEDKHLFWQTFGFGVIDDPQLISLIKQHTLWMTETKYNGRR
eukprot:69255_1